MSSAHRACIFVCMRTTLNLDDDLLAQARELSEIEEKTALVHAGLRALIAKLAAKRLAKLGGTQKQLRAAPRRRTQKRHGPG